MRLSSGRPAPLPLPAGPLLGRAAELDTLRGLLTDPEVRLVTLTGPPGVGKTRLGLAAATAAASQFADGAVAVDLTTVRDAGLVPAEIAGALRQDAGATATGELSAALAGKHLLLFVDNFEHVLPSAAWLGELLAAVPGLTALVTSRERLHLRAERELPVPPLALPGPVELADPELLAATPAVALLVRHVRSFDPGFRITPANRAALAGICVRLDGLPLALELAAPRLRLFDPAELLFRLRHRVGSLAADATDVPDRHRTLSAALAWSHDLLGPDERRMFRRLSVFVGGWTLAAAEAVCDVPDPVGTTASLVDKSLIRRTGGGDAGRFGMLESLREFAGEQLHREDETDRTRERHAEYYAGVALHIQRRVGTGDEQAAIDEVGREVGNLRAAQSTYLSTGRPGPALVLAGAVGWYSFTRGQLGEGLASLQRALAAAGDAKASDEAVGSALLMAGAIALARGDADAAEGLLLRGLQVNERLGSPRLEAIGTAFLGHVARARGRAEEAVARHTHAGRLYEQVGNLRGVAWSWYDLGLLARRRRQSERAATLLRQSLRVFRQARYQWAIGCSAWALATVELGRNRVDDAAPLVLEALDCFQAADDDRGVAQCLEAAAGVACSRDAPLPAARLLGAAGGIRGRLQAPRPEEEQGAVGAVRLRLRHRLGATSADDAEQAGGRLSTSAAVALARQVLAGPQHVPQPGTAPGEGPLTPREAEVAGLVRQGCTNRQIGRRLGISEKTTEVHVHNIIRKLGASSRAEIAAWVAERSGTGSA